MRPHRGHRPRASTRLRSMSPRFISRSLEQGKDGGHGHEHASKRLASLQAMRPVTKKRYTAPPPEVRRYKVCSLLLDSRVLRNQELNKCRQQRFASLADVVHELEEPQINWEFLLGNTPMWA